MKTQRFAFLLTVLGCFPPYSAQSDVAYASSRDLSRAIGETTFALTHVGANPICLPKVSEPAKVVILSSYRGGIQFEPAVSPDDPALIEVKVFATDQPVYLVLSGYQTIVWRIIAEPGAKIAAVALSGYQLQHILDLPEGVPLGSRAFVRNGMRQQLKCRHTVSLATEQRKAWETNTFSAIDSTIHAEQLFIVRAYGPLELGDHQFQNGGDERIVFEVKD